MNWTFAIAIYLIIWWMVLFAILPIGVRTQLEDGEVVPGSAESAPIAPQIWKKAGWTTLVSGVIFAMVYVVIVYRLIDLDAVPLGF